MIDLDELEEKLKTIAPELFDRLCHYFGFVDDDDYFDYDDDDDDGGTWILSCAYT